MIQQLLERLKHPNYQWGMIILILIVLGIGWYFIQDNQTSDVKVETTTISNEKQVTESVDVTSSETKEISKKIYVDVKGAVHHPGMYAMESNDRLYDCIQKAGGLKKEADDKRIDYAQKVSDQMTIYVPTHQEKKISVTRMPKTLDDRRNATPHSMESYTPPEGKGVDGHKINLNQADISQLQTISGIGEKRAQDIIEYRHQKGGFKSIDELKEISGIGDKTFEKLKDAVCL